MNATCFENSFLGTLLPVSQRLQAPLHARWRGPLQEKKLSHKTTNHKPQKCVFQAEGLISDHLLTAFNGNEIWGQLAYSEPISYGLQVPSDDHCRGPLWEVWGASCPFQARKQQEGRSQKARVGDFGCHHFTFQFRWIITRYFPPNISFYLEAFTITNKSYCKP